MIIIYILEIIMGYLHIDNLYKNQHIMLFKECYALEKIHGTSAHISYNSNKPEGNRVGFFSGGEKYDNFILLFDKPALESSFLQMFGSMCVTIYGEAYGGRQQGMSATYGPKLRFVAFDVKIGENWADVQNAEQVVQRFGLDFVHYKKIEVNIDNLNRERDADSEQAIRNGVGPGKKREGIVVRPTVELNWPSGRRVIEKHKREEFRETSTPRHLRVDPGLDSEQTEKMKKLLEDAEAIANEWVTAMRLEHVLDKLKVDGQDVGIEKTRDVINAMQADIEREGSGEFMWTKAASKAVGEKTCKMFHAKIKKLG